MDWVVWTSGAIILIGFLVGIYRGALRIVVSIITAAVTIVITVFATPFVANIVMEKTPLDESMKEYMVRSIVSASEEFLPEEDAGSGLTEERVQKILKAAGVDEAAPVGAPAGGLTVAPAGGLTVAPAGEAGESASSSCRA